MKIKGIKVIRHNANGINEPDDLSYPFRLDAVLRPPTFMEMPFLAIVGPREELCVLGKTRKALDRAAKALKLKGHPRMIKMTITKR